MTREDLLARIGEISVSRRDGRAALYKPLLLLVLLGRVTKGAVGRVAFVDIERRLRHLIETYSPADSANSVAQPWWHLPTSGLWRVVNAAGDVLRESGTPRGGDHVPSLEALRQQHGEFPDDVRELLARDPEAARVAAGQLLAEFFGAAGSQSHEQLLADCGFAGRDLGTNVVETAAGTEGGTHDASPVSALALGFVYANVGVLRPSARRDSYEVDADEVDRGTQAHASTVDALADHLRARGIEPRRSGAEEPRFDLAWAADGVVYVAEAKSITPSNEEQQLRLALGQVLRYRQILRSQHGTVVAIVVPERQPSDDRWLDLCSELGLMIAWPGAFDRIHAR